jgi:hypothetical protein
MITPVFGAYMLRVDISYWWIVPWINMKYYDFIFYHLWNFKPLKKKNKRHTSQFYLLKGIFLKYSLLRVLIYQFKKKERDNLTWSYFKQFAVKVPCLLVN